MVVDSISHCKKGIVAATGGNTKAKAKREIDSIGGF